MNKAMQIIYEVNAEAENFYETAIQLGDHAAYAFRDENRKGKHRSQLTNLENIAENALKTSDIFDYIKRQIARLSPWSRDCPQHPGKGFGERLKNYLEQDLAEKRNAICCAERVNIGNETDEHRQLRRRIYLHLIRHLIRQMVIQYEYRLSMQIDTEGT